jgi:Homeodomain-like domain
MKKYVVRLEAEERVALEQIVRTGKRRALTIRHANILLAVDESEAGAKMSDVQAAQAFGVAVRSIESLRKRLVEEGLESALVRKPQVRPSVERMFDGDKEAKLIAIACSSKPEGRTRWTLELLAERVVRLGIVEKCSPKTIGRVLQKTS